MSAINSNIFPNQIINLKTNTTYTVDNYDNFIETLQETNTGNQQAEIRPNETLQKIQEQVDAIFANRLSDADPRNLYAKIEVEGKFVAAIYTSGFTASVGLNIDIPNEAEAGKTLEQTRLDFILEETGGVAVYPDRNSPEFIAQIAAIDQKRAETSATSDRILLHELYNFLSLNQRVASIDQLTIEHLPGQYSEQQFNELKQTIAEQRQRAREFFA